MSSKTGTTNMDSTWIDASSDDEQILVVPDGTNIATALLAPSGITYTSDSFTGSLSTSERLEPPTFQEFSIKANPTTFDSSSLPVYPTTWPKPRTGEHKENPDTATSCDSADIDDDPELTSEQEHPHELSSAQEDVSEMPVEHEDVRAQLPDATEYPPAEEDHEQNRQDADESSCDDVTDCSSSDMDDGTDAADTRERFVDFWYDMLLVRCAQSDIFEIANLKAHLMTLDQAEQSPVNPDTSAKFRRLRRQVWTAVDTLRTIRIQCEDILNDDCIPPKKTFFQSFRTSNVLTYVLSGAVILSSFYVYRV